MTGRVGRDREVGQKGLKKGLATHLSCYDITNDTYKLSKTGDMDVKNDASFIYC